jgi:nucleotide-binding universal stress UspA family protein
VADGRFGHLPPGIFLEEIETEAQQLMQASLGRLRDAGLSGETVIVHGIPFQSIIDTAQDKGADLIVMGTHGRTGLTHALMGSVAEKVVRLAPCPVLVTRGTTEASDA